MQAAAGGTTAMGFTCSWKKSHQGKLHWGESQLSTHCKMPTSGVSGWVLFLKVNLCQPWDLGDNYRANSQVSTTGTQAVSTLTALQCTPTSEEQTEVPGTLLGQGTTSSSPADTDTVLLETAEPSGRCTQRA